MWAHSPWTCTLQPFWGLFRLCGQPQAFWGLFPGASLHFWSIWLEIKILQNAIPDKTQGPVSVLGLSVSIKWPPRYPHTNLPSPTNLGHPVRMYIAFPVWLKREDFPEKHPPAQIDFDTFLALLKISGFFYAKSSLRKAESKVTRHIFNKKISASLQFHWWKK